jgi:hypothetical protein
MIIKIMVGEPVVLPRGYVEVWWKEDMSSTWHCYDGVWSQGGEPDKEHRWRIRIVDCTDVQDLMRMMAERSPVNGTIELDYIAVLTSAPLFEGTAEADNPCLLPPPASLDEL